MKLNIDGKVTIQGEERARLIARIKSVNGRLRRLRRGNMSKTSRIWRP